MEQAAHQSQAWSTLTETEAAPEVANPAPMSTDAQAEPAPKYYYDFPKLIDALRPPIPPQGNRRERRAAAARARKAR
jgi:hypothetical protein